MEKDNKRLYFFICSIINIILSVVSILNVDSTKEEALKLIEQFPSAIQDRMSDVYSSNAVFVLPSVLCIIFSLVILFLSLRGVIKNKKGLVIGLSVAQILFADNFITVVFGIINIIIASKFEKDSTRVLKKEIPKLDKPEFSKNSVLGAAMCLAIYFSQMFIPVSASKAANYLIAIVFYIIVFALCVFIFKDELKKGFILLKDNFSSYISFILPKIGIMYLIYMISSVIVVYVLNQGVSLNQQAVEDLPLYISLPLAIAWAPIVEEILFRGCLRRLIKNDKVFIVISGVIFGLLHTMSEPTLLGVISMTIPYAVLGGGLAYIYVRTNNITTNMMCHSFHNTVVMLLQIILFHI